MEEYFDKLIRVENAEQFGALCNNQYTHISLPSSEYGKLKKLLRKRRKDSYFIFNACRLAYDTSKEGEPFHYRYLRKIKKQVQDEFLPAVTLLAEIYIDSLEHSQKTKKIRKLLSFASENQYVPAYLLYAEVALFNPRYKKKKEEESLVVAYLHQAVALGDKEKAYNLCERYSRLTKKPNPYQEEMKKYYSMRGLPYPAFECVPTQQETNFATGERTGTNNKPIPTPDYTAQDKKVEKKEDGIPTVTPLPGFTEQTFTCADPIQPPQPVQTPVQETVYVPPVQEQPTQTPEEMVSQAMSCMEGENTHYEVAIPLLKRASDHGSAQADYLLAECYKKGQGVDRNDYSAFTYYQRASEKGLYCACYRLAFCYANGEGCYKDINKASDCFERVAKVDEGACYRYGTALVNGDMFPCDRQKGIRYVKDAADKGHPDAIFDIGRYALDNTLSFFYNPQVAIQYLTMAANLGKGAAYYLLSEIFVNPQYECMDYKRAYENLQKACSLGYAPAQRAMQQGGGILLAKISGNEGAMG